MAEIGLVASVVQIADTGIKLSVTLYTFAETVLTADKSIREIASDVSLTSSVLEELGQNLKKDQKSRLCSENAVKTAEGIVKECAAIFNEINGTLETTLEKIKPRRGSEKANGRDGAHGGRKLAVAAYERLKWPFLQPKMQLLRSNLDRLKSTLVLMLNVITYARKVSEDHATPSTLEDQRNLIEDLARSNQEYTRKFKELTKAIEAGQDHLEAQKPISAMENVPSSGFLQANMVLPPSEAVHVAGETSPDITSRLTTLAKQHLPPDAGGQSDELAHYCLLINHLLQRIDAVQYKIKSDLRRRIRSDVLHMHQREADQLKDVYGHRYFTTTMGSTISWAEILHPTKSGVSRTLRDLIHPDWSERDLSNLNALPERNDDLTPPSLLTTANSGLERQGELIQRENRVERMIALERLMRPFSTGEGGIAKDTDGASYRTGRMKGRETVHPSESYKLELEQRAASAFIEQEPRARASEAEAGVQIEARQLTSPKSDHVDDGILLRSSRLSDRSSPRRKADDLTIDAITSKIALRDHSRPRTASSRFSSGSKLHEPEPLKHKYTAGTAFSSEEASSRPTADRLDQERARVHKALDDRRDNSLSMIILSEAEENGEGSGVLLAGDLRILEALTSIRDKILEVASPQRNMLTRSRPTGSASEIAEDAILTARILWRSVRLIHKNAHDRLSRAGRDLAVARLVGLVLESAPVKVKAWKGLTDIDRKIDRILDGTETRDEAIARREILRKASKKFALLTSTQRHALQEAWSPETKYKGNIQNGWKQVQRLSRSITSLSTPKRKSAQNAVVEQHSMSTPQRAKYPTVFELPADSESNLRVQLDSPERTLSAESPYHIPSPVCTDEQNEEKNELYPPRAEMLVQPERWRRSADDNWSSEALSQGNFDEDSLMESSSFLRFEETSPEDLSNLGSWAAESAAATPEPHKKAKDVKLEYEGYAENMWDSDENILTASRARDANDHNPRGIMLPVARPRTPDIVDDLLAQWTTLPR